MALDFIKQTTERSDMHPSMLDEKPAKVWELNVADRCDRCGAQAQVQVNGMEGSLLFCGHHYNDIMSTDYGYKKMMSFMISIIDERDKFKEEN